MKKKDAKYTVIGFGVIAVCIILIVLAAIFLKSILKIVLYIAIGVVIILAIAFLVIFASSRAGAKSRAKEKALIKKDDSLTPEQSQTLTEGRKTLADTRMVISRIKNTDVHGKGNDLCGLFEKIFQTLKTRPKEVDDNRQCLNYYLPTLQKVVNKYQSLEASGVVGESETTNTLNYLNEVSTAMNKLYNNLFEDDKLDLSVEMEAMSIALKRDGLS